MSQAPAYNPTVSFATEETNNAAGRSTVRTAAVDTELANIASSINALRSNQSKIIRDDDKLLDGLVEPYALSEQTRAIIATQGGNPRGTWQQNTDYAFKDIVQRNNIAQICLTPHNSGTVYNSAFWLGISGDGTSATNAANAAASASAAAASASAAASSASSASTSASNAATSASSASTSATNAANAAASSEIFADQAEAFRDQAEVLIAAITVKATQAQAEAGTNNDTYMTPLRTKEAIIALSPVSGLGVGQTWQDVSGSRTLDTNYTNTTGRPIFISVRVSVNTFNLVVGGNTLATVQGNTTGQATLVGIIPAGATYQVSRPGAGSINSWWELRS